MWKDDFSVGLSVSDIAVAVSLTSTFGIDGRRQWIFFFFFAVVEIAASVMIFNFSMHETANVHPGSTFSFGIDVVLCA